MGAPRFVFPLMLSALSGLGAARDAGATAIFGALAQATLELTGIDHAGAGRGVVVQSAYDPGPTRAGEHGDVFAIAFSEGFAGESRIDVSSFSFGEAADGSSFSSTGISAWFDVFNDSETELTAHFSVTWLLEAETLVDSGIASAMGGIQVFDTVREVPFSDSVELSPGSGSDNQSSALTRKFTMVVPPHQGHVFAVSVVAEGSSSADSRPVPEPLTVSFLTAALAAVLLAGARGRLS